MQTPVRSCWEPSASGCSVTVFRSAPPDHPPGWAGPLGRTRSLHGRPARERAAWPAFAESREEASAARRAPAARQGHAAPPPLTRPVPVTVEDSREPAAPPPPLLTCPWRPGPTRAFPPPPAPALGTEAEAALPAVTAGAALRLRRWAWLRAAGRGVRLWGGGVLCVSAGSAAPGGWGNLKKKNALRAEVVPLSKNLLWKREATTSVTAGKS